MDNERLEEFASEGHKEDKGHPPYGYRQEMVIYFIEVNILVCNDIVNNTDGANYLYSD